MKSLQFMTNEAPQPDEKGKAIGQKGKFKFLRRLRDPDEQKWQKELHLEKPADEEEEIPVELEEPDDGTISSAQTDIEQKCLRLLGLLEEYYARGDNDKEHFKQAVLLSSETNIDALLKVLEGGTSDSLEDDKPDNLHKGMAVKIQELLSVPEVKNKLFQVLETEGTNFKIAYPTLRRVARRKKVAELAPREIVKLYLKDKRTKGKLHETTKAAIGNLEKHRKQAQTDAQTEFTKASPPTKGWLIAQELLEYKKQLKENGFAKTESRKKLVDRVLDGMAHGEKMFLVGSTGTGKTQLAMLVADLINESGFEIVSWHEGTTPRDLFGYREIGTDDQGKIRSYVKKGPVAIAITEGKIVIHDEYNMGNFRTQSAQKATMNAKVGQETHLPGFNGELFTVKEGYGELFTGNPGREHMDPAILRMLSGMKVSYMPSEELFKVVLAELIDDVGFLHLSKSDIELIRRVTKASELMQMCHNREIDKLQASPAKDLIAKVFGDRLDEVHMDNNFLDTGTALRLFQGWDLEQAKGRSFSQFLHEKISGFLEDPKSDIDRDEKKLAQTIFEVCNVLTANGAVNVPAIQNDTKYIPPSKLAEVLKKEPSRRSPLSPGAAPGTEPPPLGQERTPEQTEIINKLRQEYSFQHMMLETFDVLQDLPGGKKGIIGIDNKNYPVPTFEDIEASLDDTYFEKYRQGFTSLLLVPFGMSLRDLAAKAGQKKTAQQPPIDQNPVYTDNWDIDGDVNGELVYRVKKFDQLQHGGMTKQNIMVSEGGWEVLLVEPHDAIPRDGQGQTIQGRKQIECGKQPLQYLQNLQPGGIEEGFIPEAAMVLHMKGMMQGKPYDDYNKNYNYNIGAFVPNKEYTEGNQKKFGVVPDSGWRSDYRNLLLYWDRPDGQDASGGGRSAVRIRLKTT